MVDNQRNSRIEFDITSRRSSDTWKWTNCLSNNSRKWLRNNVALDFRTTKLKLYLIGETVGRSTVDRVVENNIKIQTSCKRCWLTSILHYISWIDILSTPCATWIFYKLKCFPRPPPSSSSLSLHFYCIHLQSRIRIHTAISSSSSSLDSE